MSNPFTSNPVVGQPTWTVTTYPANAFIPQSGTGFVTVTGGYGQGGYGEGGYGNNSQSISIITNLTTTWTSFTNR